MVRMRLALVAVTLFCACADPGVPDRPINGWIVVPDAGLRFPHPKGWGWDMSVQTPDQAFLLKTKGAAFWIEKPGSAPQEADTRDRPDGSSVFVGARFPESDGARRADLEFLLDRIEVFPPPADRRYRDPEGRWSVEVPAGWFVFEEEDGSFDLWPTDKTSVLVEIRTVFDRSRDAAAWREWIERESANIREGKEAVEGWEVRDDAGHEGWRQETETRAWGRLLWTAWQGLGRSLVEIRGGEDRAQDLAGSILESFEVNAD